MVKKTLKQFFAEIKNLKEFPSLSKEEIDNLDLNAINELGYCEFFNFFSPAYEDMIIKELDYFLSSVDTKANDEYGNNVLMIAIDMVASSNINLTEATWNQLINSSDLTNEIMYKQYIQYKQNVLMCLLYLEEEDLKRMNINQFHVEKVVNAIINKNNKDSKIVNMLNFIVRYLENIPGYMSKVWPYIEDKNWFINYIEKSNNKLHKDILHYEDIKIYREKKNLSESIKVNNNNNNKGLMKI